MNPVIAQISGNLLIFWAMCLITYATMVTFTNFPNAEVSVAWATIHGSTIGILATVTGYVHKRLSDIGQYEKRT